MIKHPLDGPAIAQTLGVEGSRRKNGAFSMEFHDPKLDVRLVVVIDEQQCQVQLFIDRGKHRLPSFVGKILVVGVEGAEIDPEAKSVSFISTESGHHLTIWTDGHFTA